MLVEEHKQVLRLQTELQELRRVLRLDKEGRPLLPNEPDPAPAGRSGGPLKE
jgi:hypothetical protein